MKKHYKNKKKNKFILFLIKERILIGEHLSLTDISQYYLLWGIVKKVYCAGFFLKNHLKFFKITLFLIQKPKVPILFHSCEHTVF